MIVISLGGAVLFSAGSDHHRAETETAAGPVSTVAGEALTANGSGQHEHHRGNEWTPTAANRFRLAAAPAVLAAHPDSEPASTPVAGASISVPSLPPTVDLAQPGVLRV